MSLNLHHLRYFRAVAHDGTLTRAARDLNVSQSALSSQIKALEDRLGHPLFDRIGRRLVLTEAGRIALDHADAIHAAEEELLATLSRTGQVRQAVRVGAQATLSRNFQLSVLRPLLGREDVELILTSGSRAELLGDLDRLSLDMVLSVDPAPADAGSRFVSRQIASEPVALVARPERARGLTHPVALVAAVPMILPAATSPLRRAFDGWCGTHGLTPQIAAEVDDIAMMRLLAREDVGLALLPPIAVQDELASGFLTSAAEVPELTERFYAITRERRFPNPYVAELLS